MAASFTRRTLSEVYPKSCRSLKSRGASALRSIAALMALIGCRSYQYVPYSTSAANAPRSVESAVPVYEGDAQALLRAGALRLGTARLSGRFRASQVPRYRVRRLTEQGATHVMILDTQAAPAMLAAFPAYSPSAGAATTPAPTPVPTTLDQSPRTFTALALYVPKALRARLPAELRPVELTADAVPPSATSSLTGLQSWQQK